MWSAFFLLFLPLAWCEEASIDTVLKDLVRLAGAPPHYFLRDADALTSIGRLTAARFAADDDSGFAAVDAALAKRSYIFNSTVGSLDRNRRHLSVVVAAVAALEPLRQRVFDGDAAARAAFQTAYLRSAAVLGDAFTRALTVVIPDNDHFDDLLMRGGWQWGWWENNTAAVAKDLSLLHAQVMLIEAMYRHLAFNSPSVDAVVAAVAAVAAQARAVEAHARQLNTAKLPADLARWSRWGSRMSHCRFAHFMHDWLERRFPRLGFFVVAYNGVASLDEHAVVACPVNGSVSARAVNQGGRTSFVVGVPFRSRSNRFEAWAARVLENAQPQEAQRDTALAALRSVEAAAGGRCAPQVAAVVAVREGAGTCITARSGVQATGNVTVLHDGSERRFRVSIVQ